MKPLLARHLASILPLLLLACSNDTAGGNDTMKGVGDGGHDAAPMLCSGKAGVPGVTTVTVPESGAPDGGLRTAVVHVPAGYDASKPTMLVLNFHGLLEPNSLQESVSHMSDVADQRNFIVAYPAGLAVGLGLSWNAGTCCGNTTDDMSFVRDLVKKLQADYCVDPKRIFATGLSNGAMMSYRLACEASDVFAAVAPVAGAVQVDPCSPVRPVPILAFHGTADNIVPFNGGTDGIVHLLTFPPVSYSIDLWRSLDGCPDSPLPAKQASMPMPADSTPDGGPNPSLFAGATVVYQKGDVTCHQWSGCKANSAVELCTVVGGGHAWPGGVALPTGKTSQNIDASNAIIDFFDAHPMP